MKTFVVLLSLFISANLSAQKGRFYMNSWHRSADNKMNIPSDKYSYYEKGKLYYFLSNDNENLYVDIKTDEPSVQNRILKEGLTIWIDMDNKPVKKMGVRFPIGSEYASDHNKSGLHEGELLPDGSLVTPLTMANTIELVGFSGEDTRRFPSDNADTFRGSVEYDKEGTLHYDLTIPFAKLPLRNSKDGNGAMPFEFGIEYGAPPEDFNAHRSAPPPSQYSQASSGTGGGSRGNSSHGGGRPGGMSGNNEPPVRTNFNSGINPPVIVWVKNIKLASGM